MPYAPDGEIHILDRFAILYRYRQIAITVFILTTAVLMIQGYTNVKLFQARAQLQIEDERSTAVPGMNSGLNPGDPTLVAAFRSALLHQGAIALLMLVLVWLLWVTARTWRSAPAPGAGGPSAGGATAGGPSVGSSGEARARWLLRTGFGVLWIFDGILQAQPKMAGGLATQVIGPIAASSPGPLLFHCVAGKDRTGLIAAVMLALADVVPDAIAYDYAVSGENLREAYLQRYVDSDPADILEVVRCPEEGVHNMLSYLAGVGGIRAYLEQIGLRAAQIELIERSDARRIAAKERIFQRAGAEFIGDRGAQAQGTRQCLRLPHAHLRRRALCAAAAGIAHAGRCPRIRLSAAAEARRHEAHRGRVARGLRHR